MTDGLSIPRRTRGPGSPAGARSRSGSARAKEGPGEGIRAGS